MLLYTQFWNLRLIKYTLHLVVKMTIENVRKMEHAILHIWSKFCQNLCFRVLSSNSACFVLTPEKRVCTVRKKSTKIKYSLNIFWRGKSESNTSLKCQQFMTFTPTHQQIFIETLKRQCHEIFWHFFFH